MEDLLKIRFKVPVRTSSKKAFADVNDLVAEVEFADLYFCRVARVYTPGLPDVIYVVGAFRRWHNLNASALPLLTNFSLLRRCEWCRCCTVPEWCGCFRLLVNCRYGFNPAEVAARQV